MLIIMIMTRLFLEFCLFAPLQCQQYNIPSKSQARLLFTFWSVITSPVSLTTRTSMLVIFDPLPVRLRTRTRKPRSADST